MFRFPVRDAVRCQKWIENSGNNALADLSPNSLRNKVVCSRHFHKLSQLPKKLPLNAVPLHYDVEEGLCG
ncbi:hypothetical protein JTB14_025843 [Gonioctena quinquepunctata]|nr:hypothetical protein JTB14_025843 [Gonioctena quinquepunctata]